MDNSSYSKDPMEVDCVDQGLGEEKQNMKDERIPKIVAWVTMAIVVGIAIVLTHKISPLWAMLIPFAYSVKK